MENAPKTVRKFGVLDKLSYAAGDFGCNMSFALKGTMTLFWTQFMGVSLGAMAILTLVTQVWDAVNDPLLGAMVDADRRKYTRNKFLAYISFGSIGLIFAGALCFLPFPNLGTVVKYILYVCGYVIWDAFYTIANVPYGSILPMITTDDAQRAQLSTFRSMGAMVAGIGVGILTPMLIYDADSRLMGERIWIVALVMGVLGFVFFQFMVRTTVIRVETDLTLSEDTPKFNPLVAVRNFLRNRPAVGATLAPVGMFVGMYGAQTAVAVMFQSYFNAARYSGIFSMLSYLGMFLFVPFVTPIVKHIGKKEGVVYGTILQLIGYALMFVLPITPDTNGLIMYSVCQVIAAIGGGFMTCVSYSMMADAMDYEEWKFGVRNEGTTYALHSFFRKLAQGVGPAMGLVIAGWFGYDPALQNNQPMDVARNMVTVVAGMYVLSAVIILIGTAFVYNLDRKTLARMKAELEERHGKAGE